MDVCLSMNLVDGFILWMFCHVICVLVGYESILMQVQEGQISEADISRVAWHGITMSLSAFYMRRESWSWHRSCHVTRTNHVRGLRWLGVTRSVSLDTGRSCCTPDFPILHHSRRCLSDITLWLDGVLVSSHEFNEDTDTHW